MIRAHSIVGLVGLLVVLAMPAAAQGKGKSSKPDARASSVTTPSVTVVFRDADQATFREYFRRNRITATALPPGIAKNLARGKPLPPGIAKRAVPPALLAQGPRVAPDITFTIAGDVVVAMRSGLVVDILRNVF
jgi:hypothetical protein